MYPIGTTVFMDSTGQYYPIVVSQDGLVAPAASQVSPCQAAFRSVTTGRVEKKTKKFDRTKWSGAQKSILLWAFNERHDVGERMAQLMEMTGLPEKTINIFFANHRARSKKKAKDQDKPRRPVGRPRKVREVSEGVNVGAQCQLNQAEPPGQLGLSVGQVGGYGQEHYGNGGFQGNNFGIQFSHNVPGPSQVQNAPELYCFQPQQYQYIPQGYSESYNQFGCYNPNMPDSYTGNGVYGNNMASGQVESSQLYEIPQNVQSFVVPYDEYYPTVPGVSKSQEQSEYIGHVRQQNYGDAGETHTVESLQWPAERADCAGAEAGEFGTAQHGETECRFLTEADFPGFDFT